MWFSEMQEKEKKKKKKKRKRSTRMMMRTRMSLTILITRPRTTMMTANLTPSSDPPKGGSRKLTGRVTRK